MFSVGDYVVHRNSGICKVKEIAPLPMEDANPDAKYYYLVPLMGRGSEIFSPANDSNDNLRKVLTEQEANELLTAIPRLFDEPIENDKQREQHYKEAIRSCDCRELVKILKTLTARKQKRFAEGKKSTASEERYFKQAADSLYNELAFALKKDRSEIQQLLKAVAGIS